MESNSLTIIVKYLIQGLAVAVASSLIPKKKIGTRSVIGLALTASVVFFILDTYAPSVGKGAYQGAGISIGSQLVGGIPVVGSVSGTTGGKVEGFGNCGDSNKIEKFCGNVHKEGMYGNESGNVEYYQNYKNKKRACRCGRYNCPYCREGMNGSVSRQNLYNNAMNIELKRIQTTSSDSNLIPMSNNNGTISSKIKINKYHPNLNSVNSSGYSNNTMNGFDSMFVSSSNINSQNSIVPSFGF